MQRNMGEFEDDTITDCSLETDKYKYWEQQYDLLLERQKILADIELKKLKSQLNHINQLQNTHDVSISKIINTYNEFKDKSGELLQNITKKDKCINLSQNYHTAFKELFTTTTNIENPKLANTPNIDDILEKLQLSLGNKKIDAQMKGYAHSMKTCHQFFKQVEIVKDDAMSNATMTVTDNEHAPRKRRSHIIDSTLLTTFHINELSCSSPNSSHTTPLQ